MQAATIPSFIYSMKNILLFALFLLGIQYSMSQQKTYCNPINIDYGYTPIPDFARQGKHRATADPVITYFKGKYYLFSTNQWGYWHSERHVRLEVYTQEISQAGTQGL